MNVTAGEERGKEGQRWTAAQGGDEMADDMWG